MLAYSQLYRTRGVVYDRSEDGDFRVTDPAQLAALYNRKRLFYTESTVYPHVRLQDLLTYSPKCGSCWPAATRAIPG